MLDVPLPKPARIAVNLNGHDQFATELRGLAKGDKADIDYGAVARCIATFLTDKSVAALSSHVIDTHSESFLNGLAPDISIQRYTSTADKFNVAAIIELKGLDQQLGSLDNCGQILNYLMALATYQPGRREFIGILTNLQDAYVFQYIQGTPEEEQYPTTNTGGLTFLTRFRMACILDTLAYLAMALQWQSANPPRQPFTPAVGKLVRIVHSNPESHSVVGEFTYRGISAIGKTVANMRMKRILLQEIETIRKLQGDARPISIPELLYPNSETLILPAPEMVTSPVGRPLQLDIFKNASDFRACLEDILLAIAWVHSHGLAHRDVRTDNVLVYAANPTTLEKSDSKSLREPLWRGLLIDFDHAAVLEEECDYEGGFICCPLELIQACGANPTTTVLGNEFWLEPDTPRYKPRRSHDYLAFVLLVNTLIFPLPLQKFNCSLVLEHSSERGRLLRLLESLRGSPGWRDMVALADKAMDDVATWRQSLAMIDWL